MPSNLAHSGRHSKSWLGQPWFVAALTAALVVFLVFFMWIVPYVTERSRSPLGTFRQLALAAHDGDNVLWSSLVHAWNEEEREVKSIMSSNVVLQAQVRRGLIERFGLASYEASSFPRYLDEVPKQQISTAVEQVSGDQAALRLTPELTLKFVRVDGIWKYDFFRGTSATTPHLRKVMQRNHAALHEVIRGIAQNVYTSADDALSHFKRVRLPELETQ